MKIDELRNMNRDELIAKEFQLKEELFGLNYQRKIGRVEKPHRFKLLKKGIARIQTLLSQEEKKTSATDKT